MKLLALSVALCILLAVSLASPIEKRIRDESELSKSDESSEIQKTHKDSSSSEEDVEEHEFNIKENEKDNSSDDSSEEQPVMDNNIEEEILKEDEAHNNMYLRSENFAKSKRSVDFAPHNSNQLKVKDEGSIKYEKYLKLKRLRRALESDESKDFQGMPPHMLLRHERSADTSEEDSSEENHAVNGVVVAKKPDTAPAETLEAAAKPESAPADDQSKPVDIRRKRNPPSADTSEEDSSEENHGTNGIVIAKKPDTAPAETLEAAAKPETAPADGHPKPVDIRRKRNTPSADTSEEDSSEENAKADGVVIAKKPDTAPAETLEAAAKPASAPSESQAKPVDIRRKRNTPSADTSEEDSSEENAKANGVVIAKKPNAAPAYSEPKPEGSRRRRYVEVSSAEDSILDQDLNEVFIFSNEKHPDTAENFENDAIQNNESVILDDRNLENTNSEEDYAQGCGGSNGNQGEDDSSENSNENNDNRVDRF